jgi:hypothetical protein
MSELAGFAGLAMRMISDAKTLKDAVEQQETLTRELSHRMKNLLTITGGIVTMTAQTAATPKEMANSVVGRSTRSPRRMVRSGEQRMSRSGTATSKAPLRRSCFPMTGTHSRNDTPH